MELVISESNNNYKIFGPKSLAGRNITISSCPLSKYLNHVEQNSFKEDQLWCYELYIPEFWKNAKPWNCSTQVDLFPSDFIYEFYSSHNWHRQSAGLISEFAYIFPYTKVNSVHIFVDSQPAIFLAEMAKKSDSEVSQLCFQQVFIEPILRIETLQYDSIMLSPRNATVEKRQLVGMLNTFSVINYSSLDTGKRSVSESVNLAGINAMPPSSNLICQFNLNLPMADRVIPEMVRILKNCKTIILPNHAHRYASFVDRLALGYAHVWLALLCNYTLLSENRMEGSFAKFCSKISFPTTQSIEKLEKPHIRVLLSPYIKGMQHFPYFVYDETHRLRFISCGERGFSSIPLKELTNPFDTWVWAHILASIASFVISLRSLPEKLRESRSHWLSPLKVLLEQGDPFADDVAQERRTGTDQVKFLLGTFLLMGIVLSNAYKNTNVYNMILPKTPIPYKFFNELIQAKVTIYSRVSSYVAQDMDIRPSRDDETQLLYLNWKEIYVYGTSEITVLSSSEAAASLTLYYQDFDLILALATNSSVKIAGMADATIFHPGVEALVNSKIISWYNKTYEAEDMSDSEKLENFRRLLESEKMGLGKGELDILLGSLRECGQVAAVFPEHNCRRLSRMLRLQTNRNHEFMGKDSIPDVNWLFSIKGLVPRHIITRIKAVFESGMRTRWEELYMEIDSETGAAQVAAATMGGNVILVFFLWGSGLIAAISGFVSELVYSLFKH